MRSKSLRLSWIVLPVLAVGGVGACGSSRAEDPSGPEPSAQDSPQPSSVVNGAPPSPPAPPPPPIEPGTFATADVDVISSVRLADDRRPISPLIYGMNSKGPAPEPDDAVMQGVTFVRRGGDRCNSYNWESNVSSGSILSGFRSDMFLASSLASPNAPGEVDRALIADNRRAGRGVMVPFVMNGYVASLIADTIPYATPSWNIDQYFRRVELVKPTPFSATPDLNDGVVYTDEHLHFLRRQFSGDIFAPGPSQVMVGTDNEPDLFAFNYPMLQRGSGAPLYATNGALIGNRITGSEFTTAFIRFARRVKEMAPTAPIVGPGHYHYDGWTTWHTSGSEYSDAGRWYMDDFLTAVRMASEAAGKRLLDTWDFHWYPQRVFDGTFTWALDDAKRTMTEAEIEAVLQGPRSYWDRDYDEFSWITTDHLLGPAYVLKRLQQRIAAAYPGTKLGVTEYFPGGCGHVSSALATADTLGVFGRMGVHMAAMWPHTCDLTFAFGGFKLLRNADGNGLRFAETSVRVDHPEKAESSLYGGSDDPARVTVLVVNKTNAPRRFGIRLHGTARLDDVEIHGVDAAHPDPHLLGRDALTKTNAYAYSAPARSAALLVFHAR